jgi:hypothetical protein
VHFEVPHSAHNLIPTFNAKLKCAKKYKNIKKLLYAYYLTQNVVEINRWVTLKADLNLSKDTGLGK